MPITAANGSTTTDNINLSVSLQYLSGSPTAGYILQQNVTVNFNSSNVDSVVGLPGSRFMSWDPSSGMQVVSANGVLGVQSPAMGLLHELAHAVFGADEAAATAFETKICQELGEPTRASYTATGQFVKVDNPTEHTENGQWVQKDVLGNVVRGGMYDGGTHAPSMGWAGSVGGGGSSGGGSSGGGGGGSGGGDIQLPPYTPDPVDPGHSHWQVPQVVHPDGLEAVTIVGTQALF